MLLNLADLPLCSGQRYEHVYTLEFEPFVFGGTEYRALASGGVELTVDRVTGGYLVTVALDARVYGPCARCLGESVVAVHARQQEFGPSAKDGWEETEFSEFITDLVVDVAGLAREALILGLPAQVVCTAECMGLCTLCGRDLNHGPCGCNRQSIDERWSRLKELRLNEGGDSPDKGSAS